MIEHEIRIKIRSELYEVEESLFSDIPEDGDELEEMFAQANERDAADEKDVLRINTEGKYSFDGKRITISYNETEESGMVGSLTAVTFLVDEPEIVSMIREGNVSATLVFEEGKRYNCIYNTPIMPFEVCVRTQKVVNRLDINGTLELDYTVEIRGAKAERNKFFMQVIK